MTGGSRRQLETLVAELRPKVDRNGGRTPQYPELGAALARWIGACELDFFHARFPAASDGAPEDPLLELVRCLSAERAPGFAERVEQYKREEVVRATRLFARADGATDWGGIAKAVRSAWRLADLTDQATPEILPLIEAVSYRAVQAHQADVRHTEPLADLFALALASNGVTVTELIATATLAELVAIDPLATTKSAERGRREKFVDLAFAVARAWVARWEVDRAPAKEADATHDAIQKLLVKHEVLAKLERARQEVSDPSFPLAPSLREPLVAAVRFEQACLVSYRLQGPPRSGDTAVPDHVIAECEAVKKIHPRTVDVWRFLIKHYMARAEILEQRGDAKGAARDAATMAARCQELRASILATRKDLDELTVVADGTSDLAPWARLRLCELRLGGSASSCGDPTILAQTYWLEQDAWRIAERLGDKAARARRLAVLEAGLEANPKSVHNRRIFAELLEEEGRLDQALAVIKHCFDIDRGEETPVGLGEAKAIQDRLEAKLGKKP